MRIVLVANEKPMADPMVVGDRAQLASGVRGLPRPVDVGWLGAAMRGIVS